MLPSLTRGRQARRGHPSAVRLPICQGRRRRTRWIAFATRTTRSSTTARTSRSRSNAWRGFGYDAIELVGEPRRFDATAIAVTTERRRNRGRAAICSDLHGRGARPRPSRRERAQARLEYVKDGRRPSRPRSEPHDHRRADRRRAAWRPSPIRDEERKWAVEGLRAGGEYAAERDVNLTLECWNRYETYWLNRLDQGSRALERDRPDHGGVHGRHVPHEHRGGLDRRRAASHRVAAQPRPPRRLEPRRARRGSHRLRADPASAGATSTSPGYLPSSCCRRRPTRSASWRPAATRTSSTATPSRRSRASRPGRVRGAAGRAHEPAVRRVVPSSGSRRSRDENAGPRPAKAAELGFDVARDLPRGSRARHRRRGQRGGRRRRRGACPCAAPSGPIVTSPTRIPAMPRARAGVPADLHRPRGRRSAPRT